MPAPNPLVAKAVLGSVMLSAALAKPDVQLPAIPKLGAPPLPEVPAPPAPPAAGAELCALYRPFLERGLQIAAQT